MWNSSASKDTPTYYNATTYSELLNRGARVPKKDAENTLRTYCICTMPWNREHAACL